MKSHLVIVGAGPIGIEAGLAARARGHDVSLFERGEIADAVRRWGHVRMFSPFAMNASETGIAQLQKLGLPVPADDALLTGTEYVAQYLEPLGRDLGVKTHSAVKGIARQGMRKGDEIGEPGRGRTPFRLLIEDKTREHFVTADVIFDCTGTFSNPNPVGDGGIPALGESAVRDMIRYGLGETADLSPHQGRRTLVVGGGHSALNAVVALAALQEQNKETRIAWVSMASGPVPCARIPDDPLPERDALCARANELVASGFVTYQGGTTVYQLQRCETGIKVTMRNPEGIESVLETDFIIAATGYRPDRSLASELHAQTCWATEGTYKLAASLLGETGGDCLAVAGFGAETLIHPEPGYFALGMKSYGRTPDFLIRTGREQVQSLIDYLA